MTKKEKLREYARVAYEKVKADPIKYAEHLRKGREQYRKNGKRKFTLTCEACGKQWQTVLKKSRFCSRTCACSGSNNGRWNGGRQINKNGYIKIWQPHHPNCCVNGTVLEHRLVMEKKIKRFLRSEEVVHHIDGDKHNNDIKNLILCKDTREHTKKYHMKKITKGMLLK